MFRLRKCRRSHHLVHILIFFLTYGRGTPPPNTHPLRTLILPSGTPLGIGENRRQNNIPFRVSRDPIIDNYGRRLLDLCKSTDLVIANGRLSEDNQFGEYTCINPRGRSVVDNLMLEYSETISHFSVCEIDEHSDHCALFFRLKLSHSNTFTVDNSKQNNINNS